MMTFHQTVPQNSGVSRSPYQELVITLKCARLQQRLRQVDVAKKLGYSMTVFSNWERGRVIPNFEQVQGWASVLGFKLFLQEVECVGKKN